MNADKLNSLLQTVSRVRPARGQEDHLHVERLPTDTTWLIHVQRWVPGADLKGKYVKTAISVSDESLAVTDRNHLAKLLMEVIDAARAELDGMEFVERILAGVADCVIRIRTADDEARVERAALRLMEHVERARKR